MNYREEQIPLKTHYVAIDSRYRDKTKYASTAEYVIDFPQPFKNVISVELVHAVYEKFGIEQYINLYVEELSPNLASNNNIVAGAFTQLPLIEPLNSYDQSKFKSIRKFEQPLSKLSRMSFRFIAPDGSLYPIKEHFLRFEIRCCKHDSIIENTNMEVISERATVYVPNKEHAHEQLTISSNLANDPHYILEVGRDYTLNELISSFRRKQTKLRMQRVAHHEHQRVEQAFKTLARRFQSSA
jgi:hypothetical protein